MAIETIKNFLEIDSQIGSAGQPTQEELGEVAAAGYTAVINLGLLDPRYCLEDEAGSVAGLGLAYHHIPVQFDAPTVEDFAAFAAAMDEHSGERVFVHCAANYRVSSFLAVYGEMKLGWDREQADAVARRIWPLNDTWVQFLEMARSKFLQEKPA